MKLSEQLQQDSDGGDFGKALEGYPERAKELEDALEKISRWIVEMDYMRTIARDALKKSSA